jgi:hypothetical protein
MLKDLIALMFDEAKRRWPNLTWEEFKAIGLRVIETKGSLSPEEMSIEIERELEAKFR